MSVISRITNLIAINLPAQTATEEIKEKKDKMASFVENNIFPELEEANRLVAEENKSKAEFSENLELLKNMIEEDLKYIENQKQYSEHRKKVLDKIDTMDKLYKKALHSEIDILRTEIFSKIKEVKNDINAKKDSIGETKMKQLEKLIDDISNFLGKARNIEKFKDLVAVKKEFNKEWIKFARAVNEITGAKKKVEKKPVKKSPPPNIPPEKPSGGDTPDEVFKF